MPKQLRNNSSIIASFIEAKQAIDLELQEKRLGNIKETKMARRKARAELADPKKKKKKKVENKSAKDSEKFRSMDDHRISIDELFKRLEVSIEQGLTTDQVVVKHKIHGDNVLTERKKTPWFVELAEEMTTFFALMLWAGAGFSLLAFGLDKNDPSTLYLCIVLVVVVLIIGGSTFLQNQKSENVMASFKNFIPLKCKCLRNGAWQEIAAATLVPGDIIEVKAGDKIPADIRILKSQEMKVDNSSLTGESDALLRSTECTHPEHPLETYNLAFFGTLCKEGSGQGIVVFIGDNTVIGQIASLASSSRGQISPLTREINRFIMAVSFIAFSMGTLFFVLGFILGYSGVNSLIFAIGIIVANVPEGLLTTLTVAISIAAKRLAESKVLVKNLNSVETLGCTTVICSDKTGTLTQNRMTVANVWYSNRIRKADNYQKMGPTYQFEYDINDQNFISLHECAILGSDAIFTTAPPPDRMKIVNQTEDPQQKEKLKQKIEEQYQKEIANKLWLDRATIGDASETALVKFFQPINDIVQTRNSYPTLRMNDGSEAKMPFNSNNKFAINIVRYAAQGSHHCIFIKGAPEKIWELSSFVEHEGKTYPIDDEWRKRFKEVNISFGKNGERVLGFAKFHCPKDKFHEDYQYNTKSVDQFNFPINKFSFCGLVSLIDPPREVVPFSVNKCKSAGIQVIMVTGDQPITAAAIARKVNIFDQNVKTVNEIAEEKGISIAKAMDMSDAIVVHGDMINEAMKEDEELPESERGKRLSSWLSKPQVVFARTTPAQKLIIVQGCQKLGHTVAVTGDGVNDSPAIKKADIGIAMGITGSDVAKDAADMILLNDDFSAIVVGVQEGRKIMDNLKKCLVYSLTSNIPELLPFMSMVVLGLPLPLSTVLVLCIDLGTDMFPGFALAFEEGELDLMLRKPRGKLDHLFTLKLLSVAYVQMGTFQTWGLFLAYFYTFHCFGYQFWSVFYLHFKKGLIGSKYDAYDEYSPSLGNSRVGDLCTGKGEGEIESDSIGTLDWLYLKHAYHDLRNVFIECDGNGGVRQTVDWGECLVKQASSVTDVPVCYSTETLKYAQTAGFFAIIICQYANVVTVKTKVLSVYYQGFNNYMLPVGLGSELILTIILAFLLPIHKAIGTRDVIFHHFGLCAIPFAILQMIYDEFRKYMIRNTKAPSPFKPNWWVRNYSY